MEKGVICQEKNRLLPIEIKHTLPNWGLVDYKEVLNDFPFSNSLKQVDGKNWRLHLQKVRISLY